MKNSADVTSRSHDTGASMVRCSCTRNPVFLACWLELSTVGRQGIQHNAFRGVRIVYIDWMMVGNELGHTRRAISVCTQQQQYNMYDVYFVRVGQYPSFQLKTKKSTCMNKTCKLHRIIYIYCILKLHCTDTSILSIHGLQQRTG